MSKVNAGQAPSTLIPEYIGSDFDAVLSCADNMADLKTLVENLDDVAIVVNNIGVVTAVAPHIDDVHVVSNNIGYVQGVINNLDVVDIVANNIANVVAVAPHISDVDVVANNIGDVNTVANNIGDMGAVATNIEYVKDVADGIAGLPHVSHIGTTPPPHAVVGTEWYCTTDGRTYVYYVDADSAQWIESSPQSTIGVSDTFMLWKRSLAEIGLTLVGTFQEGCTVTAVDQAVLDFNASQAYQWKGTIPAGGKVIPVNSTPATAGGVSPTAWVDRTDGALRSELGEKPLVMSYVLTTIPDHSDAYEYALNSGRTVIVDVPLTLTRAVIKSENEPVSVRVTNGAKISPPDFAPRLRSNPEHRLNHDTERKLYTLNPTDSRHETMLSYDGVVVNRNTPDHRNLVTAYFGADSQNSPNARIWAINTVTNVHKDALFASEAYGYELDVNVDADNTGSNGPVEGLRIAGIGDFDGWQNAFAVHIMRDGSGNYKWNCGIKMREIVDGFQIYYPSRFLMLAYTDKPIKLVPSKQDGSPLFQINNPTDSATVYYVDDNGKGVFAGGVNIGGGTIVSQLRSYRSTGIGFGDIAAGASVTKTFTELFGAHTHTFTLCDVNLTIDKSGGTHAGLVFTNYTDTATGVHYIRVTNITAATILNTAFGIRATVTQF